MDPGALVDPGALPVSVVVPVRNGSRWLPDCLASLARQQGVALELLLVDDGSTDRSATLAQQVWSSLQPPWPLQVLAAAAPGASVGVSTARNLGWRQARQPLVAFLDADDLALAGRLRLQAEALCADPGLSHVMVGWRRFGAAGLSAGVDVCPWREGAGFDLEAAFRLKAVLPSAWMIRRSALEAVAGFQAGLAQAEDVDLLLRLALAGHRGSWVRQVLCGYRLHDSGASQQLAAQGRSLLWVMHQRLADLPPSHPLAARKRELVFATRAWSAWQAWQAGASDQALRLWQSSWALSPLGPARTWLHLAEGVASHCQRIGAPFASRDLLQDPRWLALEGHVLGWLAHQTAAPALPLPASQPATLQHAWSLLVFGHHQPGLSSLRCLLAEELSSLEGLALTPAELRLWFGAGAGQGGPAGSLRELRHQALDWLEQLLLWQDEPAGVAPLLRGLHDLLCGWGRLFWSLSLTPAVQRLELAFALQPSGWLLAALADLHASSAPTGSAALRQLARRLGDPALAVPPWPSRQPLPPLGRCSGPNCQECGPASAAAPTAAAPMAAGPVEADLLLHPSVVPDGIAWIRPGRWSPWGTTTQVAVQDRAGVRQPSLCRRYPQPWSGCRERASWQDRPDPAWDCPHSGPPLRLEGAVLAVADLSAEVHYHWLLDQLPRLGQALAWWQRHRGGAPLTIWCNGGGPDAATSQLRRSVLEQLIAQLGLPQPTWLSAETAPCIQADQLLVPPFAHPFGEPGQATIHWLRQTFLPLAPAPLGGGPVLWLGRGEGQRRRALGEAETLAVLQGRGVPITPVHLAALSLAEQAQLVATARLIVAPHGGALANLVFARPGTPVLELHAPDYAPPYWASIAAALALPLRRLACRQRVPELYRELVFGSALDAPILLEPPLVADAVEEILQDCRMTPPASEP